MIKVGIVGISGFAGKVLLDILLKHAGVRVTYVAANTTTGKVDEIWPQFKGRTALVCEKFNAAEAVQKADLFFLALPHTGSMSVAGELLSAGKKVIDLSADYRLHKLALYKKWYKVDHADPKNIAKAVYGLPELYRVKIKTAQLIANPGCYPTAAILGLAPMVAVYSKQIESITIDAKSGVSGAGRKVAEGFMFGFVNENFKAYRVLDHQHTPEIEQYLTSLAGRSMKVAFVPHLLPIDSGILETIYVRTNARLSQSRVETLYNKFYKTEPFVRVLSDGQQPEVRNVVRTNFCDIAVKVGEDKGLLVITSVIDNLVKGAAGQAVQNMNMICGFDEMEGLA